MSDVKYVKNHLCRMQGRRECNHTPKSFDLMKIREKSVDIWAKYVKTFAKSLYVLWFCKNGTQHQSANFFWRSSLYLVLFGQVRGDLGKFRRNLGKKVAWSVLWFQKMHRTWKEMQSFFFGGHFLWSFSGKFGEIWAKILRTPKNSPAPTPMSKATKFWQQRTSCRWIGVTDEAVINVFNCIEQTYKRVRAPFGLNKKVSFRANFSAATPSKMPSHTPMLISFHYSQLF